MKNRLSIFTLSILTMLILSCKEKTPPNFVFILVDDMGWTDLGCYGSKLYETPNIDALSKEGILFTDAYASCPVCSPTRASILTGKYPTRLQITDWIPGQNPPNTKLVGPEDQHALPHEEITIAEVLKEKGYKTFFAGKWHLGGEGFYPEVQGFDINLGGHDKGSPPGGYYTPYKNPKLSDGPAGEYLTDRLTDESIQFMERNKENPFLLYLSYYTVHTPIQANKKHIDRFKQKVQQELDPDAPEVIKEHEDGKTTVEQYNADYASMVYALDENIGRLLAKLEENGLSENTIIIFTSDNGGLSTLEAHRQTPPTSVKPLRAGKGWCYEGGIRVPLILKGPGIKTGTKNDFPVLSNDFFPTILDLAGIPLRPDLHQDGKSMVSLLEGEETLDRDAIFWHYPHYHGSAWKPGAAIRMGNWKLIEFYHHEKTELYNLKEDIGEQRELSEQYPEKVAELQSRLKEMQEETGAKFATIRQEN